VVVSSSVPDPPTAITATAGNGQATVVFSPYPLDKGIGCSIPSESGKTSGIITETDSDMREQVNAVVATGAAWIRMDIVHKSIESGTLGQRDYSNYDRVFAYAKSQGLKILGISTTLPSAVSGGNYAIGPTTGTQRTAYANSCAAAASHFVGSIAIDAMELWNEPNLSGSWSPSPSPTDYGLMIQAAYPAIKAVQPNLPVIAGGVYPAGGVDGDTWINTLYSGGYVAYLDALTLHPYADFGGSGGTAEVYVPDYRGIMNSHGDSAKALWATETGAFTAGSDKTSTSESNQAAMETRSWSYWVANAGARGVQFIYTLDDFNPYSPLATSESYFGIRYYDTSHKPAWATLASLTAANMAAITYTATASPGGLTATGSASPLTVSGLTNGQAYTFTIRGNNASGSGVTSATSNAVTPSGSPTVPGAPTGVSAVGGNAQATVSFTAPSSNGGAAIIDYTVTSSPGGFTGTATASPITVTSLANGTAYTFTVKARNSVGSSAASTNSNSVTPTAGGSMSRVVHNATATATTQTVTATYPVTPVQGHLLVACIATNAASNNALSTPSGWTLVAQANGWVTCTVFYKVAGASESTTFSATHTTGGQAAYSSAIAVYELAPFSGAPLDAQASAASLALGSLSWASGTTATTVQADELVLVAFVGEQSAANITGYTAGYTQQDAVTESGTPTALNVAFAETAVAGAESCTATRAATTTYTGAAVLATFEISALPAPLNLHTTSVGSTSIGLAWNAVTGASGYEVTVT
jgi:hypothetical protein